MKLAGEDGVAAYGVIMYVNFIFMAIFLGYSIGSAPIVRLPLRRTEPCGAEKPVQKSLLLVCGAGIISRCWRRSSRPAEVGIFVSYDAGLFEMTRHGFRLYASPSDDGHQRGLRLLLPPSITVSAAISFCARSYPDCRRAGPAAFCFKKRHLAGGRRCRSARFGGYHFSLRQKRSAIIALKKASSGSLFSIPYRRISCYAFTLSLPCAGIPWPHAPRMGF